MSTAPAGQEHFPTARHRVHALLVALAILVLQDARAVARGVRPDLAQLFMALTMAEHTRIVMKLITLREILPTR